MLWKDGGVRGVKLGGAPVLTVRGEVGVAVADGPIRETLPKRFNVLSDSADTNDFSLSDALESSRVKDFPTRVGIVSGECGLGSKAFNHGDLLLPACRRRSS